MFKNQSIMTLHDFSGGFNSSRSDYSAYKWSGAEEMDTFSRNNAGSAFMGRLLFRLFSSLFD